MGSNYIRRRWTTILPICMRQDVLELVYLERQKRMHIISHIRQSSYPIFFFLREKVIMDIFQRWQKLNLHRVVLNSRSKSYSLHLSEYPYLLLAQK